MREGVAVRHPQYGSGVVVAADTRRGANVDFGYVVAWVPLRELEFPDGGEDSLVQQSDEAEEVPDSTGMPALPSPVVAARRAVLALKLGQVLEENVHDLSIGTDQVRVDMERAIAEARQFRPQSLLVEGSYGAGKTHLLTLLTKLAADEGFATATVILDGEGVTLSEPMGLMEAVLGSLRYPSDLAPCGVGDRLADLRRLSYQEVWQGVGWRIAEAIFQVPREAFDEPEAIAVLEDYFMLTLAASRAREKLRQLGYRVSLPPLSARVLDQRPGRFCELLRGWAGFCTWTGARGLVIVFDEVDVEYAFPRGRLRGALLNAFDEMLSRSCPIVLAFGSAPPSDDVGDSNDAVEDLVASISAMTRIEAPVPSVEETKELGHRLHDLHSRAYPKSGAGVDARVLQQRLNRFADRHYEENLEPTIRGFVRGTLEILDVASNGEVERGGRE